MNTFSGTLHMWRKIIIYIKVRNLLTKKWVLQFSHYAGQDRQRFLKFVRNSEFFQTILKFNKKISAKSFLHIVSSMEFLKQYKS